MNDIGGSDWRLTVLVPVDLGPPLRYVKSTSRCSPRRAMPAEPFAHDPDWCEIAVELLDNERFKVETFTTVNRATEEQICHDGVVDEDGEVAIYDRAGEILDTFRKYLDETRCELWVQVVDEGAKYFGRRSPFWQQLDMDGDRWASWDRENPLGTSEIPAGQHCYSSIGPLQKDEAGNEYLPTDPCPYYSVRVLSG